ncbi:MAG TPA: hypothetical protein PKH32_09140, partial [Verrucomicrobiota bacterium]|nr:hypothetical protein [Verrucomicrobiota bacterium]
MNSSTLIVAALAVISVLNARGQDAASTSTTPVQGVSWNERMQQWRHPVDWLTWGGDLRLRNEYFDNALSLGDASPLHEQDYFRYRARIWASLQPWTNLSINARASAEPRTWMKPSYSSAFGNGSGTEWRYGIVDNLNVQWANALDLPLTVTVGRQDIQFGETLNWWLVADGTPGDGSWTFFLDSARMTYHATNINTRFDLVYIHQMAHPDEWLPTLDNPSSRGTDYGLTEQNEQGVIAYIANQSLKGANVDAYYIYKRNDRESFRRNGVAALTGDNADIHTLGARVHGRFKEHWLYSVEGAYQFGNREDLVSGVFTERDLRAYGANAKLTYRFKDRFDSQACLVGEFLSGDDPDTAGTDEMFDVLWGRWPRWSELYIYSYVNESRKIAQLNNIARLGATWSLHPIPDMTVSAAYNAWFAPESVPTRAASNALFTGDGHFRGHYLQAIVKHQFHKQVSAHLWTEFIWQGDYYAQRDL